MDVGNGAGRRGAGLRRGGDYDVARKAYLALPRYIFPLAGGAWIRLYSFSSMPV